MTEKGGSRFGEYLKNLRVERRISLREFCKNSGDDPGNYSRLERGLMSPPQDEKILARYANALDLKKGSEEWQMLFDIAAAEKGIIPKDILSDKKMVGYLPAFFRTLRGQKPTPEEMFKVAEKIKESEKY